MRNTETTYYLLLLDRQKNEEKGHCYKIKRSTLFVSIQILREKLKNIISVRDDKFLVMYFKFGCCYSLSYKIKRNL